MLIILLHGDFPENCVEFKNSTGVKTTQDANYFTGASIKTTECANYSTGARIQTTRMIFTPSEP